VSDASAAEGLLTDLNPTGEGWIDVRVIGPGGKVLRREFLTARRPDEAAARALELREEGEVLFGVVARLEQRGTKDAVAGVRVAWLDVDDDDAVAALDDSPFKPTCVLNSGGGRHAYYLLEDAALPYRVEALNRRLAAALGGDPRAADIGHCLRLPGTLNHKYDPPREVELLVKDGPTYTVERLERLLPEDPQEGARDPRGSPPSATSGAVQGFHRVSGEDDGEGRAKVSPARKRGIEASV
jgi:RepB DNA-primase N-terminal domain